MKLFEKILLTIIVLALILKFTFITGGNSLFVFSMMFLTLLYYPLGVLFFNEIPLKKIFKKSAYKKHSTLRLIGSFVLGMALSNVLLGILFKIQHFPGADLILPMGLIYTLIISVIIIVKFLKSKAEFYKRALLRILIIASVGLFLALLPENSISEFQYRNHPKYLEALRNYQDNPDNTELYERMIIEHEKIHLSEESFKMIYPDEEY